MATTFTEAQMGKAGAIVNIDPTKKPGRSQMFIMERTIDFDAMASSTGVAALWERLI